MPFPFLFSSGEPSTHALVVTHLKHHYLIKSGEIRYQKTKRTASEKVGQSIRLYLVCDLWTGAAFGELQPSGQSINILGFLTRAWWDAKPWTCFSGVPDRLMVSRQLQKDLAIADLLHVLESKLGLIPCPPPAFPPWYSNTIRHFEDHISEVQWQWEFHASRSAETSKPTPPLSLDELGTLTTISFTDRFRHLWLQCQSRRPEKSLSPDWIDFIDRSHEPYAGWRQLLHLDWPEMKPLNEHDPFCLY